MTGRELHQQKLFEIVGALQTNGLPADNYHIRRLAWLMRYHLVHHQIRLSAFEAVKLLKLEIAEFLVKTKGRNHVYVAMPASFN